MCPSVRHLKTFNTVKQHEPYNTDRVSTWLFLITTVTDYNMALKAATLATHSFRSSNDVNDRQVTNSFYGSSYVQYKKKVAAKFFGFQSDGNNRRTKIWQLDGS